MKRIAVWNTAFLGDAVLTLPLLQSLKLAYPEAKIDYYVRCGVGSVFEAHPAISKVYEYDKRGKEKGLSSILRLGKSLAARNYDLWISTHTSMRSGYLARASRAKMRIGYKEAVLGRLCYTHQVLRRFGELEEVERLLALLAPLGNIPLSTWPELVLPPAVRLDADNFFAALGNGPVLGQHPGSVWATKQWPLAYHAELAAKAVQSGAKVLLFASPAEKEMSNQIMAMLKNKLDAEALLRVHDLSGKLSLPSLAAYLAKLNCFVVNDSGPMHLAWAQHVPVVSAFGPTTRNLGFAPRGPRAVVLEVELPCRPCNLHGPQVCPLGHHNCMKLITPEMMWAAVKPVLWGQAQSI